MCSSRIASRIFTVDFYILQLEGCEVVLGTQWLRILGPIRWDFEMLEMQFVWNMLTVVIHGIKNGTGSSRKFLSLYLDGAKNINGVLKQNGKEKEEGMEQMLGGHGMIFAKTRELPPPRSHDHRIHPVFHISLLKRYLGSKHVSCPHLPEVLEDGKITPTPQAVLETRIKNKKPELLIHWQGLSLAKAMWEEDMINAQFPEFFLGDMEVVRGEG
jgi:hypothetical protein